MKKMKRILALALAVVLTLAMNMTVFAEETTKTYAITIKNAENGHTYEAYQIFAGDLSTAGVLSNIKWGNGVKDADKAVLGNAAQKAEDLATGTDVEKELKAKTFAQDMKEHLGTAAKTVSTSENGKYVMDGLAAGYYLIKDKDDSMTGMDDAYTSFILQVTGDQTVNAKADKPVVEKKVKDINDSTESNLTDWQDAADYDIGDKVPFQLKATLPKNVESYESYKVVFHDTLSQGLTYNADYKVTIDGVECTNSFQAAENATQLTFSCDDVIALGATNASEIVVTYTATLNEKAVIGAVGNPNEVYLEFSNNPNKGGEGETGNTPVDKVIVFTYQVDVNKVNPEEQPLTGAAFKLEKKLLDGTWSTIKDYANEKDDSITSFTFSGIDDGIYRLSETVTPEGYNTIDPIVFEVIAGHDTESADPKLLSLTGEVENGEVIVFTPELLEDTETPTGVLTTVVINQEGSTLPSTGGTGRVLLYVFGAILVVVAGILLVTKRRVNKA